jgi:predicted helicase
MQWQILSPNEHNDWINLRNDGFGEFIPLAPEKKFDGKTQSFFVAESCGVATARDNWVNNFSKEKLVDNVEKTIGFYNKQRVEYGSSGAIRIEDFVKYDSTKISWTDIFLRDAQKGLEYRFDNNSLTYCLYRPFCKQNHYFNRQLIHRTYQMTKFFPAPEIENLVICLEGTGGNKDFGCLITDKVSDYGFAGVHTHCFPLYYYEKTKQEKTLFDTLSEPKSNYYARRDGISNFILEQARKIYGSKTTKEDIFYYVYALLHNPDYRALYASDLKKMLPRLPLIDDSSDFWRYVKAGRELVDLHLHYENHAHEATGVIVEINNAVYDNYEVTKMRFPSKDDKSRIIYNPYITLTNIPAETYEYIINGKPAIEWVMERYQISVHKESGIVNNPNDWAREQGKPKYILDLLLSIITVSVRTVEIVKELPKVEL